MDYFIWQAFRYLIEANFLLLFLAGILTVFTLIIPPVRYRSLLKGAYILLLGVLVVPLFQVEKSADAFIKPLVKVYSGTSRVHFKDTEVGRGTIAARDLIASNSHETYKVMAKLDSIFFSLSGLGLIFFLTQFFWTRRKIARLLSSSFRLRQFKSVEIWATDLISGPFSILYQARSLVFIPNNMLGEGESTAMAVYHELQHHRQGDTRAVYLIELLKSLFFYNPAIWLVRSRLNILSELSVDESLTREKGVTGFEYGRCLIDVAAVMNQKETRTSFDGLVGTASLSAEASFLKRRLKMITDDKRKTNTFLGYLLTAFVLLVFGAISFTAKGLTKSHRISMGQAKELATKAQKNSSIPIYVDREVLKYLNMGLGTERGRRYIKKVLKRKKSFEGMITDYLNKYDLPLELLAIPAHESGYQNYDNGIAAGIWSFTPGTARVYGVQVSDEVDDRHDAEKLTVAAMKYYTALIHKPGFNKNWHLALLAYNSGERRLLNAIKEVGSTDVRVLAKKSKLLKRENKVYIPRLMAWLILLKNPSVLD